MVSHDQVFALYQDLGEPFFSGAYEFVNPRALADCFCYRKIHILAGVKFYGKMKSDHN
jgi:hypothetical protein